MPGLVGIVSNNEASEQLLQRMIDSVTHKPWQKTEKYSQSPFYLGRVHLGIFNPEPQPIFNEDKSVGIFLYGKIHGYQEELNELRHKHHFLLNNNDAEFCLHAYEEWGRGLAHKLNGSFVIVICDFAKKELLITNDRYGLSPLHYAITNSRLVFASELKAILQDMSLKKELNETAVADFFAFGEVNGNKTLVKGIEVLPPASILTYKGENLSIESYWNFNYEPDYSVSEDELAEQLGEAYKEAVRILFKDGLRHGVLLSGGLDSRSLLAAASEESKNITTVNFGIPGCNESEIAKIVSRIAGTKHRYFPLSPGELLTPYPEQIAYFTDGMHYINTSFLIPVYEKIRTEVDVLCEGLSLDVTLGASFMPKNIFKLKTDSELLQMLNGRRVFTDAMLSKLLGNDYYRKIKDAPLQSVNTSLQTTTGHLANRLDAFIVKNRQRRYIFMGHCPITQNFMEEVAPTYDNNFMDVILRVPPEWRFEHRIYRKFLMKLSPQLSKIPYAHTMIRPDAPLIFWKLSSKYTSAKTRLARYLIKYSGGRLNLRQPRDYAPVGAWLRLDENWRQFTRKILLADDTLLKDICSQDYIRAIVEEHESAGVDRAAPIELLLTFELFLRLCFSGKSHQQW